MRPFHHERWEVVLHLSGATTATSLHVVMGLQSFEQGLERMVEGVFSRGSRSGIRPVELGRRLLREIDDHRSVDVKGRRIVPNTFIFHLSSRDHAGFQDYVDALHSELCETAREYARTEGYHFLGPVTVELTIDDSLKPGRFAVTTRMQQAAVVPVVGTLVLGTGARIEIGDQTVTVGRLPECTVPVNDSNVSRKHCEIRSAGTRYVVLDLGSTNGTKVNGVRIQGEHTLANGDVVSVGSLEMRFEAS